MARTAIVGLACLFPGARDLASFWSNIVQGVDAITDVPPGRWDASYYDAASSAVDRFYCKRGGFVDRDASFDPLAFGIAPNTVDSIEPDQLLTLKIGFEALRDAGLDRRPFRRDRTGVIIGRGNYISAGVLRLEQHVRLLPQILQTLQDLFPDLPETALAATRDRLRQQLTHYGPDVAAGLIPNLIASRLANRLDLHGPAFTVDAACASAIVALEQACASLERRETDVMLVGGAHLTHDLTFWATFCQLGALSRRGVSSPLSSDADGILAGEGIGMAVIRRLEDALAAGDRIYAVIEGIGTSSDGRASSLVAPASSGQLIALEKAWSHVDFNRDAPGLVETHGTATPTGDQVELETLARFFGEHGEGKRPVAGSVKSMIGHAMPASGMASLIKTALSIYHGVLPPTLHCEKPHPLLAKTRFRAIGQAEEWPQAREERIAALNAFGFGGVNGHVVLRGLPENRMSAGAGRKPTVLPPVLLLAAETPELLLARLDRGERDASPGKAPCRLAIIEPNERKISLARKAIASGKPWHGRQQIWYSPRGLIGSGGKIAFVFPGVDSSFAPNAAALADNFGLKLPPCCHPLDPAKELAKVVRGVLGFNLLMFDIACRLSIRADAMAGHSIGEWTASAASGLVDRTEGEASFAGVDWEHVDFPDRPYLAASCDAARLTELLAGIEPIILTHENCPHQAIVCGDRAAIEAGLARLREARVFCQVLPMVSGFHSPWFEPSTGPFREMVAGLALKEPTVPLWSVATAAPFPAGEAERREAMFRQLLEPVRFHALTEALYEDGCRVFVQLGTGSLTNFINDNLSDRPHHAIESHSEKRGGMEQLQYLSAALWVEGAEFDTGLLAAQPEAETAAMPEAATGRQLALGVPLLRVSEPLDRALLPASMRTSALAEMPPVAANDAVGRLLQDTLADIERAGREVLEVWQQHRRGARPGAGLASPNLNVSVQKLLDIEKTIACVDDHAFHFEREGWPILADRRPVVPLTMEVLLVREAIEGVLAERGFGHLKVVEAAKIEAFNWLDVASPVTVDITIRSAGEFVFDTEIVGYFSARLLVAERYPGADAAPAPAVPLVNPRPTHVSAERLYAERWMFHGPAYQGIRRFESIGDNGIDGELEVPSGTGALLDNMGQLAGYWVMEQPDNCLAMPIGVDRIRFFGPDPRQGEKLKAEVRIFRIDEQSCVSDHVLSDADGRVRITIDGWKTRRFPMDQEVFRRSREVDTTDLSQFIPPNVAMFEERHSSVLVRDHFSWCYLTAVERESYATLAPRRRRQWLNGRIAAKDAVRGYLRHNHGVTSVYPKELRIENGSAGEPYVRPNVTETVPDTLHVSLSHKDRIAVAIVGERPVGIDIERIEPRTQGFADITFSQQEQALLAGEDFDVACTRGWVAKEAIAKAHGTGLQGRLGDFLIDARDGDCLRVNGRWVVTHRLDDYIVGWLLDVFDDATTRGLETPPDFLPTSLQARIA
jgi:acyl transferase domain-containing protein/phosphopantetheinyl transferase